MDPLACTFPMDETQMRSWLQELARLVALPSALGPRVRDELRSIALTTPERLDAPGVTLAFGGPVGARERLPELLGDPSARVAPVVEAALPIPTWICLPDIDPSGCQDDVVLRAARTADLLVWLASSDPAVEATESRFLQRFVADRGPHALIYVSDDPTCPAHVSDRLGAVILSTEDVRALLREPADAAHPRVRIARLDRARNALRRIVERIAFDLSHLDSWRDEIETQRHEEASVLEERRSRFAAVVEDAVTEYFEMLRESGIDWGERVAERVTPAGLKAENTYGEMLVSALGAASHEALGVALATISEAARDLRMQPPDSSQIRALQDMLTPRRVFVLLPTPQWRSAVRKVAREATRGAAALAIAVESWLPQGAGRPKEVLRSVADVATESANAPDPDVAAGRRQVRAAARLAVQSLVARRAEAIALLLECRPAAGSVRRTAEPDAAREQALRTTLERLERLLSP